MKIFLSSWPGRTNQEALNRRGVRHRLLSYNDLRAPDWLRKIEAAGSLAEAVHMKAPAGGLELMLDSGAFAAWKRGVVISFDEYLAFVIKYSKSFDWIVNLDVIPGQRGQKPKPSQAEIDKSAAIGWQNYYALKEALGPEEGTKLIHVFHDGEHKRWLQKLLDEGGDYIGISPRNDRGTHWRRDWLDIIMPYLTDSQGWPIRKFHGFGVTSEDLMLRYPWHSVDSTSWVMSSRHGACCIPMPTTPAKASYIRNGVPVEKRTVVFSSRRSRNPQHFDRLPESEQALVVAYLRSIGIGDVRMLREDYCRSCGTTLESRKSRVHVCSVDPSPGNR